MLRRFRKYHTSQGFFGSSWSCGRFTTRFRLTRGKRGAEADGRVGKKKEKKKEKKSEKKKNEVVLHPREDGQAMQHGGGVSD